MSTLLTINSVETLHNKKSTFCEDVMFPGRWIFYVD